MRSERVVYQLKVTLEDCEPPIWRRFAIVGDAVLVNVHYVLQVVMGWQAYHLHEFRVGDAAYGEITPDSDPEMFDEAHVALETVLTRPKDKLTYIYDFGDDWRHKVVLEKIYPYEADEPVVVCLEGARACPPEDCGGPPGFEHFVEAISDRRHPDHEMMLDWYAEFDPEEFNLEEINTLLIALTEPEPKPPRKQKKASKAKKKR